MIELDASRAQLRPCKERLFLGRRNLQRNASGLLRMVRFASPARAKRLSAFYSLILCRFGEEQDHFHAHRRSPAPTASSSSLTDLRACLRALPNPGALLEEIITKAPFGLQLYARDGRRVFVNPMHRHLIEQRAHHVELSVAHEGLLVFGDRIRLSQVVSNLLTNAAHHTPANGTIRVSALIALTGYGQRADRERSHAAGFADHLVKPVDLSALLGILARRLPQQDT